MKMSLDCIPCIINNFVQLLKKDDIPETIREPALRRLLTFLAQADYRQSPPVLGRDIHRMIRQELNNPDPYRDVKTRYNKMLLDLYPKFEAMVNRAEDSFDTAMRLAIAGNVIDFGSQHQLDIFETIDRVMEAQLAIDDSQLLKTDLAAANHLLYIGDNCGEIVLDKLFLSHIDVEHITFVVRDGPVINDITMEDARMVGIDQIADIITTGDDSPGAVWETASDQFKRIFYAADVIISKGQGNLEGLLDIPGNIYFLFVSKCDLIANEIGVQRGDFVVKRNPHRA